MLVNFTFKKLEKEKKQGAPSADDTKTNPYEKNIMSS